jgi:hypothetical protein
MTSLAMLPVFILCALASSAAIAQTRQMEAAGSSLAIDAPCARSVTIQPDSTLAEKFTLQATAAHPEELAQLRFDGGATVKLRGPKGQCWGEDGGSFVRTLDIALHVPPHVAMAIEESGGSKYVIGDVGGKLALDVSGGVTMQIGSTADIALDLSGGGDITLRQIDGSLTADISGGGSVRIDRAAMPDLTLSLSGGGSLTLDQGAVKTLALDVSGAGNVRIGATAGDATIAVSGSGNVDIAKVTGSFDKDVDGSGSVTIGATQ